MIQHQRNLNMYPGVRIPERIHLSQYDSDFTLVFSLYSSAGSFSVESGTTAMIRGTKGDGNGYSASASLSGTTVTVQGNNQMTAVAGPNTFELALTRSGKVLSTANFILDVEPAAMDANTIQSDSILMELQAIIDSASTSTAAAARAEAAAEEAEGHANGTVRFDINQDKTAEEKERARKNIGVLSISDGLSYGAKSRLIQLFESALYKSPEIEEVREELREMFGVSNVPYMHFYGHSTALQRDEYELGYLTINSTVNNTRGLLVSTNGVHKIPYNNNTVSPYYPIRIPEGVKYITWLNGTENNLAMSYQIVVWDSQINKWKRIKDSDFYYSNLDGSQFYFNVSDVNDGNIYVVSAVYVSNGEEEYLISASGYNHRAITNMSTTPIDEALFNKLILEFV